MSEIYHYGTDEENADDGFEAQSHPNDFIETTGSMPVVVESTVFGIKPLKLTVNGEELELPQALRQVAHVLSQNKAGKIEATPADPDKRGGGIAPIEQSGVDPEITPEIEKTHKKSSHKFFD